MSLSLKCPTSSLLFPKIKIRYFNFDLITRTNNAKCFECMKLLLKICRDNWDSEKYAANLICAAMTSDFQFGESSFFPFFLQRNFRTRFIEFNFAFNCVPQMLHFLLLLLHRSSVSQLDSAYWREPTSIILMEYRKGTTKTVFSIDFYYIRYAILRTFFFG